MHSCIFNHRSTRCLDGLLRLILRLPAQPFSELVGEVDPHPVSLHPPYGAPGFCLLGFLFIQGVLQTPWSFGKNLRTPLRSWGLPFRFLVSCVFCRRFQGCQWIFFHCPFRSRCWVFSSAWSTNHLVSIRHCCRVDIFLRSCLTGFFGLCLSQKFLCFLGDPKFWEGLLRAYKQFPGKSSLRLLFSSFSNKEGLLRYLPCSLTLLLWCPYFLFIFRGREN